MESGALLPVGADANVVGPFTDAMFDPSGG
jgi:hypothetical protein